MSGRGVTAARKFFGGNVSTPIVEYNDWISRFDHTILAYLPSPKIYDLCKRLLYLWPGKGFESRFPIYKVGQMEMIDNRSASRPLRDDEKWFYDYVPNPTCQVVNTNDLVMTKQLLEGVLGKRGLLWDCLCKTYGVDGACTVMPLTFCFPRDVREWDTHFKGHLQVGQQPMYMYYYKGEYRVSGHFNDVARFAGMGGGEEGKEGEGMVIQHYETNAALHRDHRFNLRCFVLLTVSADGQVRVWLYKNGNVYYTRKPYLLGSGDEANAIPGLRVSRHLYDMDYPTTIRELAKQVYPKESWNPIWEEVIPDKLAAVVHSVVNNLKGSKCVTGEPCYLLLGAHFMMTQKKDEDGNVGFDAKILKFDLDPRLDMGQDCVDKSMRTKLKRDVLELFGHLDVRGEKGQRYCGAFGTELENEFRELKL